MSSAGRSPHSPGASIRPGTNRDCRRPAQLMVYVALLRGINVGGNNIIPMATLRLVFERLGFDGVRTYINSGNVIFQTSSRSLKMLTADIERAIEGETGLRVATLV